ncbi:hypothetical protein DM860_018015 [Cuscuta australis]|uniref:Uncharacterized protein n=1 Tax=Cuscuta australis TaxID=267555 RepID=A0A328E858_9ASTE|nr:hypothetical protein DM860_018015 [Cuscuta australis]
MAIVIQRVCPREYVSVTRHAKTAHDFMLVNEEMKPVVLTLWEDFVMNQGWDITSLLESGRHPIILGKRVTVTHRCLLLSPTTLQVCNESINRLFVLFDVMVLK